MKPMKPSLMMRERVTLACPLSMLVTSEKEGSIDPTFSRTSSLVCWRSCSARCARPRKTKSREQHIVDTKATYTVENFAVVRSGRDASEARMALETARVRLGGVRLKQRELEAEVASIERTPWVTGTSRACRYGRVTQ